MSDPPGEELTLAEKARLFFDSFPDMLYRYQNASQYPAMAPIFSAAQNHGLHFPKELTEVQLHHLKLVCWHLCGIIPFCMHTGLQVPAAYVYLMWYVVGWHASRMNFWRTGHQPEPIADVFPTLMKDYVMQFLSGDITCSADDDKITYGQHLGNLNGIVYSATHFGPLQALSAVVANSATYFEEFKGFSLACFAHYSDHYEWLDKARTVTMILSLLMAHGVNCVSFTLFMIRLSNCNFSPFAVYDNTVQFNKNFVDGVLREALRYMQREELLEVESFKAVFRDILQTCKEHVSEQVGAFAWALCESESSGVANDDESSEDHPPYTLSASDPMQSDLPGSEYDSE